ncbi:hypothetical protein [Sodalis sp. CWE]|nr:hypothetical protein [Sodalis sp. CWE]MBX4181038.1 hypothetical protein [Sodalis sp. CWE]
MSIPLHITFIATIDQCLERRNYFFSDQGSVLVDTLQKKSSAPAFLFFLS